MINNLQKKITTLCFLVFFVFVFPAQTNAAVFDCFMEGDLKTLLKAEFDINADNEVLKSIPREKQDAALFVLQRLQLGRNLFVSQTCTERVASSLVKWVEAELEISKLESTLGDMLSVFDKVAEISVAKVVTIAKYSRISINSMLAGSYLLGDSTTKERIVYEYIGFRGKNNDNEAWKKVINRYEGYKEQSGIPDFAQKALKILDDETENRDLHTYAQFIYDSYQIAQEVDSNSMAKEQLKKEVGKIISGIDIAIQPASQSFFSRIVTVITATVVKAADAVQAFIVNGAQRVKEFFTGAISQKDDAEIKFGDLSGQISKALSNAANKENTIPMQPSKLSDQPKLPSLTPGQMDVKKVTEIIVKTYGQVDQRAGELAKTEAEKLVSCLDSAVKERLLDNNLTIVIMPSDSSIIDLPELSNLKGKRTKLGYLYDAIDGTFAYNLVVIKENDFIHHSGKILSDLGLKGGRVLLHEFGHAIETLGFSNEEHLKLRLAYQEYKNKINPEIDREEEYFAERTPEYFEYIIPRYPLTAELLRGIYPCIAQELDRGKTVRAIIIDSSDIPLSNIPFSIASARPSNFEFLYGGITDGDGAIEVTSLIPGRYTLNIQDSFPSRDPQSTGEQLPYSSIKFDITNTDIDLGKIYQESFFGNNYPTVHEPNIMIDGAITAAYLVSPVRFILKWDVPLERRNSGCVLEYHDLKKERQVTVYESDQLEISSPAETLEMTYTYALTCGDKKKEVTLWPRK